MTFTKEQLDRMVQDATTLGNRFRGCQIHGDVCTHVVALAGEYERLQQSCNSWSDAFYREERRATEYHNTDAKCGHPAACIRNVEGCGAVCLMCRQQAEIDRLRAEVERLAKEVERPQPMPTQLPVSDIRSHSHERLAQIVEAQMNEIRELTNDLPSRQRQRAESAEAQLCEIAEFLGGDARHAPDGERTIAGLVKATVTRMTERHTEIVGELYGKGFRVLGWHLNGAEEPLDSWFEENEWL